MVTVDGEWTTWSEWSGCSAKCGDLAEVHRLRHCQNPAPMNSGRPCRGPVQQDRLCQGSCGPNGKFSSCMSMKKYMCMLNI